METSDVTPPVAATPAEKIAHMDQAVVKIRELKELQKKADAVLEELRYTIELQAQYLRLGVEKEQIAHLIRADDVRPSDPRFSHFKEEVPGRLLSRFPKHAIIGVSLHDGRELAFVSAVPMRFA